MPLELKIDGLPKIGCLRISAKVVESDLVKLDLMFSHAPMMLFHIEHCSLFSLGAMRSQFKSRIVGPLLWTESLV